MILFIADPQVWENYFNNLTGEEHYQHYLNFNRGNIINLGVEKGFEIPFFLSHEIDSIINVDPAGEENLDSYVKFFTNAHKENFF